MLFTNLRIENSETPSDIRVEEGHFSAIEAALEPLPGEEVIDLEGKLVLPPFIESHVHLDSALTAGQPRWNESGTLFEGIACWSERKKTLSHADIKHRVNETLRMQASHGVQYVRTHVDITDPDLVGMEALLELREEVSEWMNIQIVAFPQEGILSYPQGVDLLENALKMGADAVGAIPHYEFTREYSVESLNIAMELAEKYDKLVDVHCDEIDDEASRGLETLAARAYESGMKDRVTASHTTAMHSYNNAYASKLYRLLALSEINIICNPLVNIHLQGRFDTYPKRRGTTRVKELLQHGINVSMGHDDIFDPWYPLGTGNMLDVIHMGLHVCQMMGRKDILDSYRFVTHNAARTLHIQESYGLKPGNPADFIVLDSNDFYDALNHKAAVVRSYHHGKLVASTKPAETVLFY